MDIGIDLGTTFSVLAVNGRGELSGDYPPGIYLEEADVTIIPAPDGAPTFPSVTAADPDSPDRWLFGADAVDLVEHAAAVVMFSKRKMGTREQIPIGSTAVTARDIAREFLRYLKQCAEQALGRPVKRAVVTHPAYFDRLAVEDTRQAAEKAGFDMSLPEQMLMEPVAAALTFTLSDSRDPLRILTYDLGGGTFDVSYLERRSGVIDMRAFDGDHLLGGYNFDRELAHWLRTKLAQQGREIHLDENDAGDRARLARLLRLAEKVKLDLAEAKSDTTPVQIRGRNILVDVHGKQVPISAQMTRTEFVELIAPYLQRTIECSLNALQKANVDPAAVDEVLLVGGSTHGPWIFQRVQEAFPKATPRQFEPDLCVAAGAAIHARTVLPPVFDIGDYKLQLEVPDQSAIQVIDVVGSVVGPKYTPVTAALTATLVRRATGETSQMQLSGDGRFHFADIELTEDGPDAFSLAVGDNATSLCEHDFEVRYSKQTSDASTVRTVLPKPLLVETVNGFIALAKEGEQLPARCVDHFTILNARPQIKLKIFQEDDHVGAIYIPLDGIAEEHRAQSKVHLEVVVTEASQIVGQARICTRNDEKVTVDINASFEPPAIPETETLRQDFGRLKSRFEVEVRDGLQRDELAGPGLTLIQRIEKSFAQQPVERQEVYADLRRLIILLDPPTYGLTPSKREFLSDLARLRRLCQPTDESPSAESPPPGQDGGDQAAGRPKSGGIPAAQDRFQYAAAISQIELAGLAAYEKRDRKAWTAAQDEILRLRAVLEKWGDVRTLTPAGAKDRAVNNVLRQIWLLQDRAAAMHQDGELVAWTSQLHDIQAGLIAVVQNIKNIDEDQPQDTVCAQIDQILSQQLAPIEHQITDFGVDVRH